jgi:hypothetical protein
MAPRRIGPRPRPPKSFTRVGRSLSPGMSERRGTTTRRSRGSVSVVTAASREIRPGAGPDAIALDCLPRSGLSWVMDLEHYYTTPGPFTDPGDLDSYARDALRDVPHDPSGIAEALRGIQIHAYWIERYGGKIPQERRQRESAVRGFRARLEIIRGLDPRTFSAPRPHERKLVGTCRDFSLVFCAVLRLQGIPARCRCGFGTYFLPGHYEDHWIVEHYDAGSGRWVMADPQLDELMVGALRIGFDPDDLPAGAFLSGGDAWLLCRRGEADPDRFGIHDIHGWDFVKGDLVRDVAALAKREMLPWDFWGIIELPYAELGAAELGLLDEAARAAPMTCADTGPAIALYDVSPSLVVPPRVRTLRGGAVVEESVAELASRP